MKSSKSSKDEKKFLQLTGRSSSHLVAYENSLLHPLALKAFLKLQKEAKKEDIEIKIASSYRSYERQLLIWNEKAQGVRALLDSNSRPLERKNLSNEETLWAILRWSALPGASRHHWGSDMDIFDAQAVAADYKLQLIPQEYDKEGPFYKLSQWLEERIENKKAFGFYRPYQKDQGGTAPEPWHLSFAPLALELIEEYQFEIFYQNIERANLELKDEVLDNALEIYTRFWLA